MLLVCTGNICRFAFAERLGRAFLAQTLGQDADQVRIVSAGTRAVVGSEMHPDSALHPGSGTACRTDLTSRGSSRARRGLVCDGSLLGKRVAVLGAAFKPDSDDIRDSPALNVAAQLQLQGAVVRVTDPAAVENSQKLWPQLDYAATAEEAAERADAVLVLTERREYRRLDPVAFGEVVAQKRVLDGRNALDREAWVAAGWTYRALGRRAG